MHGPQPTMMHTASWNRPERGRDLPRRARRTGGRSWAAVALFCAVSGAVSLGFEPAAAADAWIQQQPVQSQCSSSVNFTDNGSGPRPAPVTLVPILWGFDDSGLDARLFVTYEQIAGSNYYNWLPTEYGAPALDYVSPMSLNPQHSSGTINDSDLQSDLEGFINAGDFNNVGPNPVFVIHLQPGAITNLLGSNCSTAFGYNSNKRTWSNFPSIYDYWYIVLPDPSTCPAQPGFRSIRALRIVTS